jgi:cobalamin biosynthesis Mg chelatase CobN
MSPSYQADNDAALRASLTTLLSCAAAARGLPKHNEQRTGAGAGVVPSSQPMELRLVPESELLADAPPPQPPTTPASGGAKQHQQQARTASNSSAPSAPSSSTTSRDPAENKTKRGAAAPPSRSARATKKKRTSAALLEHEAVDSAAAPFFSSVSPTLLTWVVSAGVVVLVSVVGFGAGYVIGREVGRQEGVATSLTGGGAAGNTSAAAAAAAARGCGSELVRSGGGGVDVGSGTLRRIRWGGVGKSVAA